MHRGGISKLFDHYNVDLAERQPPTRQNWAICGVCFSAGCGSGQGRWAVLPPLPQNNSSGNVGNGNAIPVFFDIALPLPCNQSGGIRPALYSTNAVIREYKNTLPSVRFSPV